MKKLIILAAIVFLAVATTSFAAGSNATATGNQSQSGGGSQSYFSINSGMGHSPIVITNAGAGTIQGTTGTATANGSLLQPASANLTQTQNMGGTTNQTIGSGYSIGTRFSNVSVGQGGVQNQTTSYGASQTLTVSASSY